MKKIGLLKVILVTLSLLAMLCATVLPVMASGNNIEEYRKSVVLTESTIEYTSVEYGLQFSLNGTGTGFGIGKPNEKVQYIATCNHCVSDHPGVYSVEVDKDGNILSFVFCGEVASYPKTIEHPEKGTIEIIDYFTAELKDLIAVFSVSTSDYVSMSVVDRDESSDVAICQIASAPTDKIKALPLKTHEKTSVGETIYAIGYPYISNLSTGEHAFDQNDATVTRGIVSKITLTYGTQVKQSRQFYAIQVDADTTHGNSGGPLVSEDGSIVGINAFGDVDGGVSANYAISIDELIKLLDTNRIPYSFRSFDFSKLLTICAIVLGILVIAAIVVVVIMNMKKRSSAKNGNDAQKQSGQGKYYLYGINGYFAGRKFQIENKAIIGRDPDRCNVVFPPNQPGVSSVHCEVSVNGGVLTITDFNSTYGTFINRNTKLTPNITTVIRCNETFWVGDESNKFEVRY